MTAITQAAFARHLNVGRNYVHKLKKNDRLVMTPEGLVDVEASEAKIKASADPGKIAVAERHAAKRAQQAAAVNEQKTEKTAAESAEQEYPDQPGTPDYQKARARKETANAEIAEMESRARAGQLMETAAVMAAVADAGTTFRTHIATLPTILAPQLATINDENQIRLLLEDHIEQALGELVERLAVAGKDGV